MKKISVVLNATQVEFIARKCHVSIDEGQKRMAHAESHGDEYFDHDALMAKEIIDAIAVAARNAES